MNKKTTFWAATLCIVNCALCIISCSTDELAADQLTAGKFPLELTAANISVAQTRATADDEWTGGESVGVKVDGDDNVYTYTTDAKGKLTSTSPYYWKSTEDIKVTAWYPYDAINSEGETVHKVQTDQSAVGDEVENEKYQNSDFIKANKTISYYGNDKALTFYHQVAKINVNLTYGEGVTEEDKAKTTVSIFDGTNYIVANFYDTYDFSINNTRINGSVHRALIMPATISGKFIKVNFGNGDFFYPLESNTEFEAGKSYTYTIKVGKTGLTLTGCTIGKWNEIEDTDEHDAKMDLEEMLKEKAKDNVIDLSTLTANLTVSGGVTLTGTTKYNITIADGSYVILKDATITSNYASAIKCNGNATIYLEGENTVTGGNNKCGIEAGPTGSTLTIDGSGSLEATGGSESAGIGSSYVFRSFTSCGNITIRGGKVTATGGFEGAGIGSGYHYSSCGDITISGGTVTAMGGEGAAGIGSGKESSSCKSITITGGTITAKGGYYASAIGSGNKGSSCGDITITSGVTQVTVTKGTNAPNYIGAGNSGSCGEIKIDEAAKEKIVDENGNQISL